MPKIKFLMFSIVLISLVLTACGKAAVSENQVLAPIRYDTVSYPEMSFSDILPDPEPGVTQAFKLYDALTLANEESAVCQLPGTEKELVVTSGIGTKPYPSEFCYKFPTKKITLDTQQDPVTGCEASAKTKNECIGQISKSVNLMNGAKGTASYQIQYEIVMNSDTPENMALLVQAGSYTNLMNEFNSKSREVFRESQVIDPQEEIAGTIRESVADLWFDKLNDPKGVFANSEYASLFKIYSLTVTFFKVEGLDVAPINNNQLLEAAKTYPTVEALACGQRYTDPDDINECMKNFGNLYNGSNIGTPTP